MVCLNCPDTTTQDHTYVCDCGHRHDDHVPHVGCRLCKCERYSQEHQLKPGEGRKAILTETTKVGE